MSREYYRHLEVGDFAGRRISVYRSNYTLSAKDYVITPKPQQA